MITAAAGSARAIGGFLPLECGSGNAGDGVLSFWRVTDRNAWMFVNARSALAYLLRTADIQRLWLPAFICPELVQAAGRSVAVGYYPLDAALSPNLDALSELLQPGDCVVGVDYFGRPPAPEFRAFVADRADIVWVEDRAQALLPGDTAWAEWVLYSPRKLFGVADGGILVRMNGDVASADHVEGNGEDRADPRVRRRDDTLERDNAVWYAAYQEVEANMTVSREAMSATTSRILGSLDPEAIMLRRKRNFSALAEELNDASLFKESSEDFVPFGFPVRVRNRDQVWQALSGRRVFAARYWPQLPSGLADFPEAHALSGELLLLPCDQRYDEDDMGAVAAAFRDAQACRTLT